MNERPGFKSKNVSDNTNRKPKCSAQDCPSRLIQSNYWKTLLNLGISLRDMHTNLPRTAIIRSSNPLSADSQGHKTYLALSPDKQTHNYDTESANHRAFQSP